MKLSKDLLPCRKGFTILLFLLFTIQAVAQHDSLIFKNGDIIVGELKSMDKGIITIETDYSDKDFAIEWSGLKEIYSKSIFLITLSDGRRFSASFQSSDSGKKVRLRDIDGQEIETVLDEIVFLKGLKSKFWSRFKANVDMGISLNKANNLNQLTINTKLGYLTHRWQLDEYYNMVQSSQDSVSDTKRIDAGLSIRYFLQNDWFLATSLSFLSNTEQALKLRTTGKLGGGRFFVHTNKLYWGAAIGLSFNHETFTNETDARSSLEGYAATELNMFDIGDLNLLSSVIIYPSLTEAGRWRTDFDFDAKYDLPLDFYIKGTISLNYDNKPAVEGKETDFVISFTVGWEL